jgi:hypothetical protein
MRVKGDEMVSVLAVTLVAVTLLCLLVVLSFFIERGSQNRIESVG